MRRAAPMLLAASLAGCAQTSSVALDRAVVGYDRNVARSASELLLLNIARVHRDMPPHFTAVTNIAASFEFRSSGGVAPAATGDRGWIPVPTVTGAVAERPTMTVVPLQGDEFARRLVAPFTEERVALLLGQGYDVDALLRLLGDGLRVGTGSSEQTLHNRPSDRAGYTAFRRTLTHLSSVQDRNALHVDALRAQLHRVVPAAQFTGAEVRAHVSDPGFTYDPQRRVYEFDTESVGRVVISNFDLASLSNDERLRMQTDTAHLRTDEVVIDVREGYPGGEMPIRAVLRLRSFMNVLAFVARGISAEPEYDVAPDPRTPRSANNPARTLGIVEARGAPAGSDLSVTLGDRTYALAPDQGYPWNHRAFGILYQLFQLTMPPPRTRGPIISIDRDRETRPEDLQGLDQD